MSNNNICFYGVIRIIVTNQFTSKYLSLSGPLVYPIALEKVCVCVCVWWGGGGGELGKYFSYLHKTYIVGTH